MDQFTDQVAKKLDRRASIRYAYNFPMSSVDKDLWQFISSFAEKEDIQVQRVLPYGRATSIEIPSIPNDGMFAKPCLTHGLIIRNDGSVAPCCKCLVEERNHPFQFGNARNKSLESIHFDFITHPLLQMLRAIGFLDVMKWLAESALANYVKLPLADDICKLCYDLFTEPLISEYVSERAARPENMLRIAILVSRLLKDNRMLAHVIKELRNESENIKDYDLAASIVEENGCDLDY